MVVLEANHGVVVAGLVLLPPYVEEEEGEIGLVMLLRTTAIWGFETELALILAKCFNLSESIIDSNWVFPKLKENKSY